MAAAGLDCNAADSADTALERLGAGPYQLVLCDDAAVRPRAEDALAGLRRAAPDARILHLLDSRSVTLGADLRRRIAEALSWLPVGGAGTDADAARLGSDLAQALELATPMAGLLLDQRGVILVANQVAAGAGCTPGNALPALASFPLTTWSLAESQAAHRRLLERALDDARLSTEAPTRMFALRASRLPGGALLMSGCEIADADDEINQAPRLLSPREERLQALEGFAAGMTREFSELIGIVAGCAHLLRALFPRAESDPDLRPIVVPLEQSVRQGSELIARLRAFGHQGEPARESLDAVELLRDWSRAVRGFVGGDIRIEIESDRASCLVAGSRKLLHESLMQLAANAIDAVRSGRKQSPLIRMRLVPDRLQGGAPAVALAIADNGCGIDETVGERIFDPFFTTKGPSSKGLGLATVSSTARAHGGEVRVTSRAGEGSEFRLLLPVAGDQAQPIGSSLGATPRLLLVDGDRLALEVTAHALRALGCQVAAVSNTLTAARMCAAGKGEFDVVVLDGGFGPDLGSKIVDAARAAGIPRVVVLGAGTERQGLHRLADRVLRKPCSAWDLLEAVRGASPPPDQLSGSLPPKDIP
jgi:signal transduction histidine kinase/CheY-like chemotaxis protein